MPYSPAEPVLERRHFDSLNEAIAYLTQHEFEFLGSMRRWRKLDAISNVVVLVEIVSWGNRAVLVTRRRPWPRRLRGF
jgi:hypothetical protein